jgi:hypothetical protein
MRKSFILIVLALFLLFPNLTNPQTMKNKEATFNLSREEFLKGNFRIIEGILAGKEPITTDASELVIIHSEVVGLIKGEEELIKSAIEKKVGAFVYPNAIPPGYVHFADIEIDGKIFIMQQDLASELKDIEQEIRELNNKDYFTNKIFK